MSSDLMPRSCSAFRTAVMRMAFSWRAASAADACVRTPMPTTASSGWEVTVPVPVTVTVLAAPGTPAGGGHGRLGDGQATVAIAGRAWTAGPPAGAGWATALLEPTAPAADPVATDAGAVGRAGEARDGMTVATVMAMAAARTASAMRRVCMGCSLCSGRGVGRPCEFRSFPDGETDAAQSDRPVSAPSVRASDHRRYTSHRVRAGSSVGEQGAFNPRVEGSIPSRPTVVSICPNCAEQNPDRARFCLNCGTALTAPRHREERKVVSVLFCDLVGFTARSDRADPEDVKAVLRPFHSRLKREIELHGGTLDKFIGDAALGVFGSPVAHEDDPERAVRAGLAILAAIGELNESHPELHLAVRIAINTGIAVVAYGSGPQIGEAVTGDVVNTASRLQSVAPINGVLVGETTFRATERTFEFEALTPVTVKGKSEPLAVWVVRGPRARFGTDAAPPPATPYVGREGELRALRSALEDAFRERMPRLTSVVGEPGVGKSRLVGELGREIDRRPESVVWRQGRCLPYGEGITFWALGEIVKAHAGILESDGVDAIAPKLDAVLPRAEADRAWLRQRLAPLVGLDAGSPADREESFTAWRRFLESIATEDPTVLVFEVLHWADPAMLAFIESLVSGASGVPLLVVCTARPELYERHPGWAADAMTLALAPLSAAETSRLVGALLDEAELPSGVLSVVLERAGGNPLYAEEFVRMLRDRELLVERNGTLTVPEGVEIPFPDSIQALIAARLDTVAPDRKAILQDASVVGKVFWSGALAAMGGRDRG